jgi:hypothetical protein
MRRPRLTIQRGMVALIFLAILLWALPVVGPDLVRRRVACRREAVRHAREAGWWTAAIPAMKAFKSPGSSAWARRRAAYHSRMSARYRRALYLPWEWYTLDGQSTP